MIAGFLHHSVTVKTQTLLHELAHILCGHLTDLIDIGDIDREIQVFARDDCFYALDWVKELIIINKKYKAPEELDQKIDVESVMELLENNNLIHQKEEQSRASRVK